MLTIIHGILADHPCICLMGVPINIVVSPNRKLLMQHMNAPNNSTDSILLLF